MNAPTPEQQWAGAFSPEESAALERHAKEPGMEPCERCGKGFMPSPARDFPVSLCLACGNELRRQAEAYRSNIKGETR